MLPRSSSDVHRACQLSQLTRRVLFRHDQKTKPRRRNRYLKTIRVARLDPQQTLIAGVCNLLLLEEHTEVHNLQRLQKLVRKTRQIPRLDPGVIRCLEKDLKLGRRPLFDYLLKFR